MNKSMKNFLIFVSVTTALCSILFYGCQKQTAADQQGQAQIVANKDFSKDMTMIMSIVNEGDVLQITSNADNSGTYIFKITSAKSLKDQPPTALGQVRCKGNGAISCVKNAIDQYGCQEVRGNSDIGYTSSDCNR